ncbi:unnamed protein product, partial [Heterosigma akashiwo]
MEPVINFKALHRDLLKGNAELAQTCLAEGEVRGGGTPRCWPCRPPSGTSATSTGASWVRRGWAGTRGA